MEIPRLLVASLLIAIAVAGVVAHDAAADAVGAQESAGAASTAKEEAALRAELEQLNAKISVLERTKELKSKDDDITKLGKVIEEKTQKVATLKSEITSLQSKGSVATEEQTGKANAQAIELEKQVHGACLPPWLATHAARSLEVVSGHWNQHGKPAVDLLLQKASEKSAQAKKWAEPHLETAKTEWIPVMKEKWVVVKTNTEPYVQKVSTKSVEVYEASRDAIAPHVVKVQEFADPYFQEAKKFSKPYIDQLAKVHGACLPPWLATHAARSLEVVSGHWNQHGKPAVDLLLQKASEKSAQAKKWAEPHLDTAKTKWIPAMKEKWVVVKTNTEPYVQKVSTKSVEVYEASRDTIAPHVIKVQEFADRYFQEAKKFSKPYIDQLARVTKPHVEKIRITLKPYTKRAVRAYGRFIESAASYHHPAQETILDYLHKHEATKPLATKELVWFLASALLALPVYILYSLLVDSSCTKKQTKSSRSGNANHGHRRYKRRHADK